MDALLDLPMVLTLDQVGRLRECLGTDRAATAFSIADEIAAMGWMPYLFSPERDAARELTQALRQFTGLRVQLLELLGEAMSLEEVSIYRVSWARRAAEHARAKGGDAGLTRALDEFAALAEAATDLPAARGTSVPTLRRAAARVDFCLGAVLQFAGEVRHADRRRAHAVPGLRAESRAGERIAELARQGLSAARQLRARLLVRSAS